MSLAWWKRPVHALAYGLGTGLSPFAPGTAGTLVGVALFWVMAPLPPAHYAAITVLLALVGVFVCGQTAHDLGLKDPGVIVYDEIVGFLVAMYLLPADWRWVLAGFVVYRLFDIWKPWPIRLLEQSLGLGGGIVADDIMAGLYTLAALHTARWVLERLG